MYELSVVYHHDSGRCNRPMGQKIGTQHNFNITMFLRCSLISNDKVNCFKFFIIHAELKMFIPVSDIHPVYDSSYTTPLYPYTGS